MIKKITKNKNFIPLILILAISVFLRFFNYQNRWGLAYDQARDVIISGYALSNHLIPLIGPFSASGPFVFGPYMYWIYMLVTFVYPSSVMLLWIFQTTFSAFMVILMFFIGKEVLNRNFGLLAAFLTSISTAQIAQSTNLTYSTFVGFISMFVLFFSVKAIKSDRNIYFFLLSLLFIGLAVNIHFQAVGLIPILFLLPFFTRFSVKKVLIILSGFIIPFIPILIFDFKSNYFESSHLISYFLAGGSNIALQKRWLTYVGVFWPNAISGMIGGYPIIGYLIAIIGILTVAYSFWTKKISKIIYFCIALFLTNFIILRYYKANVYDAFLTFLHPLIFILVTWVIFSLKKISYPIALIFLIIISAFGLAKDYEEIKNATNLTAKISMNYMVKSINKFPNQKFSVYDYNLKTVHRSVPLVMYLMKKDLIDNSGRKIGLVVATNSAMLEKFNSPLIAEAVGDLVLLDLNNYDEKKLEDMKWHPVNPSYIYRSVEEWY